MHAGCAGGFNVGTLRSRPVFVMSYRHEDSVLGDQRAVTVCIYASRIRDVVPVRLEKMNHLVFVGEELPEVNYGPVVTDLVSAANRVSSVETVSTVFVVSLPGCVVGLLQDVRMAGVIAHDKNHGRNLSGVQPDESCKIDS